MGAKTWVAAATVLAITLPTLARSDDDPAWKVTLGEYVYSDYLGVDLNARWRANGTSAWGGVYDDRVFGTQMRAGADTAINIGKYLQLQPSIQAASRGFLGGSFTIQAGDAWYGLAGIGRTDARPYFNLNFDPNDSLTLGAGHHTDTGISYYAVLIEDDRFHTGQRDWHANLKIPFGASHATLDLLHKTGLSEAGRISAWGGSANYDWPRWFLRLAYDPYQNFSPQSVWRFAGGLRF